MNAIEIILALPGLIGVGGISTNVQTKSKELSFKLLENKERRYKSCLLYMDVYFQPQNIKYLSSRQSDISSGLDVVEYLNAEYLEMILYAAKPVVLSVKEFIESPTRNKILATIIVMRQDLWAKGRTLQSMISPYPMGIPRVGGRSWSGCAKPRKRSPETVGRHSLDVVLY